MHAIEEQAGEPCSRFDGVACVRGGRLLFEGLSLTLGPGEAAAGRPAPTAAGKSSLLRLAAGLLRAARRAGRARRRWRWPTSISRSTASCRSATRSRFWAGATSTPAMAAMGLDAARRGAGADAVAGQRKRAALARVVGVGRAAVAARRAAPTASTPTGSRGSTRRSAAHRAAGGAVLAAIAPAARAATGAELELGDDGALILRELRRALGGAALLPLVFFLLVATLFPFAVGPDAPLLARTGGGALWMAALLAALLPVDRLVEPDRADGVLDQLALRGVSEESVALRQDRRPLAELRPAADARRAPGRGAAEADRRDVLSRLELGLLVGTPGLAALAVAVAALTAGLPRAGALAGLLLLPLAVPLLIFGAAAERRAGRRSAARRGLAAAGRRRAVRRRRRDPRRLGLSRDQRAKIAVGSSRPRASSRTAMSPHSTVPPRSPSAWREQLADRQRRHAHRIDGEHEEAAVGVEQPAAIGDQAGQILLEPPDLALRPAAELGRIEDDAVIAPAAPHLARGELGGVVDHPADRPVGHARQRGIGLARLDRFLRGVDMGQPRARRRSAPACRRRYSRTG